MCRCRLPYCSRRYAFIRRDCPVKIARILTKIKGYTPKICPIYPKEECKNVIPLFEDKEVYKGIEAQIESAGASLSDEKDSEIYLFCNLPVGKMQNIDNLKGRQYDERDCRL